MELTSAASLLARFRDVASTALMSAWVKKKHKSALCPAQEPVLKTPHHRIDHEAHSQHHDDIGKDCRAFEKALRIDQGRAHAAATCNHLGGKGGDKAHRHNDPERRKNARKARRQNHMQEYTEPVAAERERRPDELPAHGARCAVGADDDGKYASKGHK